MDWPFSHAPEPQQLQTYFGALSPFEPVSWDTDLYATINISPSANETLEKWLLSKYLIMNNLSLFYKLQSA